MAEVYPSESRWCRYVVRAHLAELREDSRTDATYTQSGHWALASPALHIAAE